MSNVSKKVKSYAEKVESGQKLVQLWLDRDKWELIQKAADSVQEPVTAWIRRAIFASLRKWELPTMKSSTFEKCSICGQRHDKQEHFKGE
jgi:hypothetical protein